jgi:predicted N-acetyltransferase YhbS
MLRRQKGSSVIGRALLRDEIALVWTIDRSEVVENVYRLENGNLVLQAEHHDVRGWPIGEAAKYTPILLDCFDRGGWFHGVFDDARLIGVVVLDNEFLGKHKDQLQMKFLHVSRSYRNSGVGRRLFELAKGVARERGATRLYISATPSENTVRFYRGLGCTVSAEPDPELFALEPDDIHLECKV